MILHCSSSRAMIIFALGGVTGSSYDFHSSICNVLCQLHRCRIGESFWCINSQHSLLTWPWWGLAHRPVSAASRDPGRKARVHSDFEDRLRSHHMFSLQVWNSGTQTFAQPMMPLCLLSVGSALSLHISAAWSR